ncbi:MAG: hypothetical protein HRU19_30615 [Pseudobacteriovorax sp.]|nr:hypothetical protein [Pseudobacteriovorax sp.]
MKLRSNTIMLPLTTIALSFGLTQCSDDDDNQPSQADICSVAEGDILLGDETYPEGIVRAANGTVYIGGFNDSKIYKSNGCAGQAEILSEDEQLRDILGLEIDAQGKYLYACDVSNPTRSNALENPRVLVLDTANGAIVATHSLGAQGLCNDLGFDNQGNLYVTDSIQHGIFKIDQADLLTSSDSNEIWAQDAEWATLEGFSVNGIEFVDGYLYTSVYNAGTIWRIDPSNAASAEQLTIDAELTAPDGIVKESDSSILVAEQGAGKLTRISVNGSNGTATTVFADLDSPATVAYSNGFVWLPVSQFDHYFAAEEVDRNAFDPEFKAVIREVK